MPRFNHLPLLLTLSLLPALPALAQSAAPSPCRTPRAGRAAAGLGTVE
ncbi:MAG: hypothetical protein PBU96_09570 [Stenotrophomonas geniculata]